MPDTSTLGMFVAASFVLLVIPGPTVMYIVARGIHQGRTAALVSTMGVEIGTLIQLLVATLGLSALVMSSDLMFDVVKYLGASYLTWLGISTILSRGSHAVDETLGRSALMPVFLQGVLVEVLNPKTALFFLAFLPQFADPARGPLASQMLMLGMLFIVLAVFNDGLIGLFSGTVGGWLRESSGFFTAQRYTSGGIYLLLAVHTALATVSTS